jgi:hypothetical protein
MSLSFPFTVPSKESNKPFGKKKELATIYCLAEMDRNKGGGIIVKRKPEEILFITEAYYPIWLIASGRNTLVFDGLCLCKHKMSLDVLPRADVFIEEVKSKGKQVDDCINILNNNLNYFQNFIGKNEKTINGLITDQKILKELQQYLPQAKRITGLISNKMIINSVIEEIDLQKFADDLAEIRKDLRRDVKNLNQIIKNLISLADKYTALLKTRANRVNKSAKKEIVQFEFRANKGKERNQKILEKKIDILSKKIEKQILKIQKEKKILEEQKNKLINYAEHCEEKISNCQARKDDDALERWETTLQKNKETTFEKEKKTTEIETIIKKLEQFLENEITNFKAEIDKENKNFEIELNQIKLKNDAKILEAEENARRLRDAIATLIKQINALLEIRKTDLSEFDKIGLKKVKRKNTMVYIPFFLVGYRRESKKRYRLYSPSIANYMSPVTKIKGVFSTSKINNILINWSIAKNLNQIIKLINQDQIFEEKIVRAAIKTNILSNKLTRKKIAKGLEDLKKENWLSESEFRSIKKQLIKFA